MKKVLSLIMGVLIILTGCSGSQGEAGTEMRAEGPPESFTVHNASQEYYGYLALAREEHMMLSDDTEALVGNGEQVEKGQAVLKIRNESKAEAYRTSKYNLNESKQKVGAIQNEINHVRAGSANNPAANEIIQGLERDKAAAQAEVNRLDFELSNMSVEEVKYAPMDGQVLISEKGITIQSKEKVVQLTVSEGVVENFSKDKKFKFLDRAKHVIAEGQVKLIAPSETETTLGKEAKYVVEFTATLSDAKYLKNQTIVIAEGDTRFTIPKEFVKQEADKWFVMTLNGNNKKYVTVDEVQDDKGVVIVSSGLAQDEEIIKLDSQEV